MKPARGTALLWGVDVHIGSVFQSAGHPPAAGGPP